MSKKKSGKKRKPRKHLTHRELRLVQAFLKAKGNITKGQAAVEAGCDGSLRAHNTLAH